MNRILMTILRVAQQLCGVRGMACYLLLLALCSSGCRPHREAGVFDLDAAVDEAVQLDRLCLVQSHRSYMASSYDRTGRNHDMGNSIAKLPNGRMLIADVNGPGCVQRFWGTAFHEEDKLFFFLDGEKSPRVVRAVKDFIDNRRSFGSAHPFRARAGAFSYLPIPFAKSLRIEGELNPQAYYQVTWRQFDRRSVESFPVIQDEATSNRIVEIGGAWSGYEDGQSEHSYRWVDDERVVGPGQTHGLVVDGGGVVRRLVVALEFPEDTGITEQNVALRRSIVRAYWNGSDRPSISAPLGAFFCNAWRMKNFNSQPVSSSNGVFTCRFPMPFMDGASFEIHNGGDVPVSIQLRAGVTPLPDVRARDLRYLHAAWHSSLDDGKRRLPHMVLSCEGRGHYAGCSMTVESGERSYMILEGDETVFVDGEEVPSHHGTGLEDYFNGSFYYFRGLSSYPWHGVLERVPYRTLQYRFHVTDAIPFDKNFKLAFERGDRMAQQPMASSVPGRLESVAYYYLAEPTTVPLPDPARIDIARCAVSPGELMAMLYTLEATEEVDEAAQLCRQFAEDHAKSPYAGVVDLRRQLYGLTKEDGTRTELLAAMSGSDDALTSQQARDLLDLEEEDGAALVGFQSSTKSVAYVDGQQIGESEHHARYNCKAVKLGAGAHTLALEVQPGGRERWIQAAIHGQGKRIGGRARTDIFRDACVVFLEKPAGWPLPDLSKGEVVDRARFRFETRVPEAYAAFEPNAYIDMQSGPATIIRAHADQVNRTLYIVRQFDW